MTESTEPDDAERADDRGLLAARSTFLVRLQRDVSGEVTGVVEAVRTGEKRRFVGTRAIGPVIDGLLTRPGDVDRGETEAL